MAAFEPWETTFRAAQSIAEDAKNFDDAMSQMCAFARKKKEMLGGSAYWDEAEKQLKDFPFETVVDWARRGLKALPKIVLKWDLLIVDLGDCPETFRMYQLLSQEWMIESEFKAITESDPPNIHYSELELCFSKSLQGEFYDMGEDLFFENTRELGEWHDFLVGNRKATYLIWLAISSMAILEALKGAAFRKSILKKRERLYILIGFEELFMYLTTVTR